ncbi:MAG: hypothetical protein ABI581_06870 [Sediminibacterium sp.]
MHRRKFIQQSALASLAIGSQSFQCNEDKISKAIPFTVNSDIANVSIFEPGNSWHKKVIGLKVDDESAKMLEVHSAHGTYAKVVIQNSFPYNVIDNVKPIIMVRDNYRLPGDPATYLFPIDDTMILQHGPLTPGPNYGIDGSCTDGADHHLIIIDKSTKQLYELYQPHKLSTNMYECWGSATFDLDKYKGRFPDYMASDAAGFPILAGTLTYEDLTSDKPINHALRMTIRGPRPEAWLPAVNHNYGGNLSGLPMGARLRLKESVNIDTDPQKPMPLLHRKIITCLKEYGAIIADGGTNFALAAIDDKNSFTNNRLKSLPWYVEETDGQNTFNLSNRNVTVIDPQTGLKDNPSISGSDFEVIDREIGARL